MYYFFPKGLVGVWTEILFHTILHFCLTLTSFLLVFLSILPYQSPLNTPHPALYGLLSLWELLLAELLLLRHLGILMNKVIFIFF